jgi:hypothetical protein
MRHAAVLEFLKEIQMPNGNWNQFIDNMRKIQSEVLESYSKSKNQEENGLCHLLYIAVWKSRTNWALFLTTDIEKSLNLSKNQNTGLRIWFWRFFMALWNEKRK